LPSLAVASHLWICLFVSRTSISRSIFQIALCRPPRCLTVVSRIFVMPQECPPAKSHGFSVLTRICIATCTSTWFAGNLPGYVHGGVHIATAVPHADISGLKHSKHVDCKD
jgi:hypothetical protein